MHAAVRAAVVAGIPAALFSVHTDDDPWPGTDLVPVLVEEHGLSEPYEEFLRGYDALFQRAAAERVLPGFRDMIADPWSIPARARGLTDRLAAAAGGRETDVAALVREAASVLGVEPPATAVDEDLVGRRSGFAERAVAVERVLTAAAADVEAAFSALEPGARLDLRAGLEALYDELRGNVYVHTNPDHVAAWKAFGEVDLVPLLRAAERIAPLADPTFAERLYEAFTEDRPDRPADVPGVEGRLLYAKETDAGWVLIGSSGKNSYDLPIAFLLELGGDDTYSGLATRSDLDHPVNVVIDRKGNDRYETDGDLAQGCGVFGVSLLADHAGSDTYVGRRVVQGAGLAGVGILVDSSGRDTYTGDAYAQGAGCFGVGILVDRDGDDVSTGNLYSQGFAAPASFGCLIDVAGDDERTARGVYPSGYGTEGEFNAFSMGSAVGFRTLDWTTTKAAGGVGVLVDCEGDDQSVVGEFGFGIGYFMGTGIVRDMGGNDSVDASRYGVATGAHYGIGVVLDDSGDDVYTNPHTASLAGNWDLTLSFLLDASGDDRYVGAGISLGSSTITSLACFVDAAGKDVYETSGRNCFGNAGHAQDVTRGTRSLALFLDLGGEDDTYPQTGLEPGPQNGFENVRRRSDTAEERSAETGVGVFCDR